MSTQELPLLIMRLVAGSLALLVCWPHLFLLLGLRRYRGGTYGGPEDLAAEEMSEEYRQKYRQLLAHGFTPLGIYWSRIGRTISTQSYVFASREHRCLAQIYSRSNNLYLVTAFRGGDVIYTMDTCPRELEEALK